MNFISELELKEAVLRFSGYGMEPEGGISRIFGSQAYREAAAAMKDYMESEGLSSYIDSVGNVHGILRGSGSQPCRELLIGSHLDTVQEGGRFDGLLGVVAGVLCCRQLQREGRHLPFDLHVIATNGEEGNDLGGTFGSRCMVGAFDFSAPGIEEKLRRYSLTPEAVRAAELDFSRAMGWLELHIEQGPTLEENGDELGVVTGIVGLQRYSILVEGKSNHAGTTMMAYRRDAVVRAAELICAGDALARSLGEELVCTFSNIEIHPNTTAVINDRVKLLLEFRNRNEALMEQFIRGLRRRFEGGQDVRVTFEQTAGKAPVECGGGFIAAAETACRTLGARYRKMPSGATHDGNMMALRVPIGMLFVPSRGGISHSREEWTDWSQCRLGCEALYRTILNLEGGQ